MSELGEISICYSIRFERRSKHSPARFWRAITEADEVGRWMGHPARIDLKVGGDYFVDFARVDGGALDGVITKVEPEQALFYTWGWSMLAWELEPDGAGCRYRFVHHGQKPRLVPDEEGLAAGWHAWLEDLDRYVDDGLDPKSELGSSRVQQLSRQYRPILEAALGDALAAPATR